MKIKYEVEADIKVGSELLPLNIDILNKYFPILESTCSYNIIDWGCIFGRTQGGKNLSKLTSITVVDFPKNAFSPQKALLNIKWNGYESFIISKVNNEIDD